MMNDYTPERRCYRVPYSERAEAGCRGIVPRRLLLGSPVRLWLAEGAVMAAVFGAFWMAAVVL